MVINIMSRSKAKSASYKLPCRTAIISINNLEDKTPHFSGDTNLVAVLPLVFDDVRGDESGCMNEDDAILIKNFINNVGDKIDRLIVHCEFGVSRSSGIAAAILKALSGNDSAIFDDPKYVPNMHCYRLVLNSLLDENGNLTISPRECSLSSICGDERLCSLCPKHCV